MVYLWNEVNKLMCAHRKWSPRPMTKWKSRFRAVCMLPLSDKRDGAGGCAYTDTPYPLESIEYFWGDVQHPLPLQWPGKLPVWIILPCAFIFFNERILKMKWFFSLYYVWDHDQFIDNFCLTRSLQAFL